MQEPQLSWRCAGAATKEMQYLKNTIISLKDITVSYDGEQVLGGFNLEIHEGEFVTLLGPSGCGKTTVLRTIAGFIRPDAGDVFFHDKNITGLPPHKREVNTIFQKYALFPHLNVYENIAFGMRLKGRSEKEIKGTVQEMLAMVNLTGYAHRHRPAFRRPAAAGGHRPGPGQRTEGPAAG